jgi:hypothetical protein
MHFENKFNPIAKRKPVHNACQPAIEKAPGGAFFTGNRYQQGRERHGRKPSQIELRENQAEKNASEQRQHNVQRSFPLKPGSVQLLSLLRCVASKYRSLAIAARQQIANAR